MKQSREALNKVRDYIEKQKSKDKLDHRYKTNTAELDQALTAADTAIVWLNVLYRLAEANEANEAPSLFDEDYHVGQGVKVAVSY